MYFGRMGKVIHLKSCEVDHYLTVEETAHRLGIKPTVVRNYLYEGKLRTYKFKTLTLVSMDDIEAWIERRGRAS